MKFEQFQQVSNEEENKKNDHLETLESKFGKSVKCFKDWWHVGALAAAVLVAGEQVGENMVNDGEYNRHVMSSVDKEGQHIREGYEIKIREVFGDDVIVSISYGDKQAFFERQEKERKEPSINGFDQQGLDNVAKYGFTEKHLFYPKGWIAGEVGQVDLCDSIESLSINGEDRVKAGEFKEHIFSKPTLYVYQINRGDSNKKEATRIKIDLIAHELGHANDWETDMDLSLNERYELLLKVHERMTAPDSWHREKDHYHETFVDGTKGGLYRSANEYWAEICGEYFSNPESFLKIHPADFELVDTYAKKNDPSFDVFNKDRGAFDTHTGKIKERWAEKK